MTRGKFVRPSYESSGLLHARFPIRYPALHATAIRQVTMDRRGFVHSFALSLAGASALRHQRFEAFEAAPLSRIGLELYSVRDAMRANPERTLAAVRAIGYTDVELLWSFGNFGRTPQQVRDVARARRPSRSVGPHRAGNSAEGLGEKPRRRHAAWSRVPDRPQPSGRDEPFARPMACLGGSIQRGGSDGAARGDLARLSQRTRSRQTDRRRRSI